MIMWKRDRQLIVDSLCEIRVVTEIVLLGRIASLLGGRSLKCAWRKAEVEICGRDTYEVSLVHLIANRSRVK